jgi:alpha-tubulin suppressor-like RCC1 family protein
MRQGGALLCWGFNATGQVGNGEAPGQGDPEDISEPLPVAVPGTWASVSAGGGHTCAVATDGTLWCWGSNAGGAVGDPPAGADEVRPDPVQVGTDDTWVEVAAGSVVSCGRRADGTLWCWGSNHDGGVGNGLVERDTAVDTPSQVGTDADWVGVSARDHVCGVRAGGALLCWGENFTGEQGNDTVFISGEPREVRQ